MWLEACRLLFYITPCKPIVFFLCKSQELCTRRSFSSMIPVGAICAQLTGIQEQQYPWLFDMVSFLFFTAAGCLCVCISAQLVPRLHCAIVWVKCALQSGYDIQVLIRLIISISYAHIRLPPLPILQAMLTFDRNRHTVNIGLLSSE